VELGHHLSPHLSTLDLAVTLHGDRRLEPQGRGLVVDEREDPAIAAELVSRAFLRERINTGRKQPLTLQADDGNTMLAATLECRLEELGELRSLSRPRVSTENTYSGSLFRKMEYRPDYPRKPFTSKEQACQWVADFVDWYKHQHRHTESNS